MGTLALDTDKVGPDIYSTLGLKESEKEAFESPRVLSLLSTLLERSVHINEVLLETAEIEDPVTVFHGLRAPTLSIRQYIERIFKYSGCSPSCFVVANIYVDRFLQRTDIHLTTLNVHRILITSVMVAAKFIDDAFFNNAYYARVGGVSTSELNILEMKFLFSIDFRLQVTVEKFGRYCSLLEKEAVEGLHIERLIQTNFSEHSLDEFLRRQIWMAAKLDGPSSHEVLLVDCPNPVQAREIRVVDELGMALRTSGNLPEGQRIWMVTTEGICSYKVL